MDKNPHFVGDVIALTKPKITLMALLVAAAGILHASPEGFFWQSLVSLLAIGALVGGGSALNMYLERAQDKKMERTKNRPLPSGRLSAWWAIVVGLLCSSVACCLLYTISNGLTLAFSIFALVMYVLCYTPLKQKSWTALLVGSIPGAMPVVLGYLSLANAIDAKAIALFSWAFLWQVPHFLAISLFREQEYINAGFPIFSTRFGTVAAKRLVLVSSWLLVLSTIGLFMSGITSNVGLILCLLFGGLFLVICHQGFGSIPTHQWAKRSFRASLYYQGALFAVLIMAAL